MAVYQPGAEGAEVAKIQSRLKELGYYPGPIDGDFGGGTESAVRAFQRAQRLTVDGIVGPKTWDRLFPQEEIPTPAILQKPLAYRCLALTGAPIPECFAGLSGDNILEKLQLDDRREAARFARERGLLVSAAGFS